MRKHHDSGNARFGPSKCALMKVRRTELKLYYGNNFFLGKYNALHWVQKPGVVACKRIKEREKISYDFQLCFCPVHEGNHIRWS